MKKNSDISRGPTRGKLRLIIALSMLATLACGCRRRIADRPAGEPVAITAPLGLPPVPIPADNPPTAQTIALGKKLFYDTRLSKDNALACATCHSPAHDFSDTNRLSKGFGGAIGVRNAPTLINVAYMPSQFWDGRAASLELQAARPIADPIEMNQTHDVSVSKLAKDADYRRLFTDAFGSPDVTMSRVEKSLASFERTILSGNSPFDRYQYGSDPKALTPEQARGLSLFLDPNKGNCAACHTIGPQYALFTDGNSITSAWESMMKGIPRTWDVSTRRPSNRTQAPSRRRPYATSQERLLTCTMGACRPWSRSLIFMQAAATPTHTLTARFALFI